MGAGHDSDGKGNDGGKPKSKAGVWDGLRTFGASVLEGFIGGAAARPAAKGHDPVTEHERPAAAKQIHRSLKAWRERAAHEDVIHREPGDKTPKEELTPLLHPEALSAVNGLPDEQLTKVLEHMRGPRKQDVNDLLRIFTIKTNRGKAIPEGDVMSYLTARLAGAAETQERRYPFGFEDETKYATFCARVKEAVGHWGLPVDDIRVQGSSVSRADPKDIDVAVMVDATKFTSLVTQFKANTGKDRIKSMIDTDAAKGKITSFCMDRMEVPKDSGLGQPLEGARSVQIQLVHAIDDGNADAKGTSATVQISIVKIGGEFDLGPFIAV